MHKIVDAIRAKLASLSPATLKRPCYRTPEAFAIQNLVFLHAAHRPPKFSASTLARRADGLLAAAAFTSGRLRLEGRKIDFMLPQGCQVHAWRVASARSFWLQALSLRLCLEHPRAGDMFTEDLSLHANRPHLTPNLEAQGHWQRCLHIAHVLKSRSPDS